MENKSEDPTNLSKFKIFKAYHLFLFSRIESGEVLFLLHSSKSKPDEYIHFKGKMKRSACVIFAMAGKLLKKTAGLLTTTNIAHLHHQDPTKLGEITIHEQLDEIRPERGFNNLLNDYVKSLVKTPYIYQDETDTATYFLEIPFVNLEVLDKVIHSKKLHFSFKYASINQISHQNSFAPRTKTSLTCNLKLSEYCSQYILTA